MMVCAQLGLSPWSTHNIDFLGSVLKRLNLVPTERNS